jgi:hypothetical protein|tara:strand:+ start:3097 stop:3504 length:408 start_codon:yes stop_codon:yes gene_type:complete
MEQFLNKHILKIAIIISLPLMAAWAFADDHNYTFHGHQIDLVESSPPVYTGTITDAKATGRDTIEIKVRDGRKFDLELNFCFDLQFAQGFVFGRQGNMSYFNRVEPGLRIYTVSWGKISTSYPCWITKVTPITDV